METLGRILIIRAVFALVMGIIYEIVNARSTSSLGVPTRFEQANGAPPGFENGERQASPDGGREFRGERNESGWLFEALRNIAIIGILVALIVVPRSWIQKRGSTVFNGKA